MCLPKKIVRYTIGGLGVGLLVLGIVALVIFLKLAGTELIKSLEIESIIKIIGIVLFCLFLIGALLGVLAAKTENRCCICLDQCYLSLLLVIFLVILIACIYMDTLFKEYIDKFCEGDKDNNLGEKIDEIFQDKVDIIFCSYLRDETAGSHTRIPDPSTGNDIGCACKMSLSDYNSKFQSQISGETNWQYGDPNVDETDGVLKLLKCSDWETIFYDGDAPNSDIMKVMGLIEEEFDCSQICNPGRYYYFSDVRKGIPPEGCKDGFKKYIGKKIQAITIISGFCVAIGIIVIAFGCCLCCHPDRKDKQHRKM